MNTRTLAAVAVLVAAQSAHAQQKPLDGFEAYAAKAMADWRVPGMAIAIVKDDQVVFSKGFGVRELGKPEPVTEHTRFGIMSTTKAFTTMLLAMLADSGALSLDDHVSKHLPTLQFSDPYVTREATVRDLVTHRIGFADPGYLWAESGLTFAQLYDRVRLVPAQTSFRSHYAYNNVSYALAGEVAARAGKSSWQSLMSTRIFTPLGMSESFADAALMLAAGTNDVSAPHGIVRDTVRRLPVAPGVVDNVAPAGATFSNVVDMAKWMRFLLDSGRVNGKRLVSAARFNEFWTPQTVIPQPDFYPTTTLTKPHFTAYGLGWFLEDYRGEFVAFHTGSIEGRTAIVGLLPERRLGVVIFTNLDHSEVRHALMYTVFDRYIGAEAKPHDWSAELRAMYKTFSDSSLARQARADAKRVLGTRPSLTLDKYTGAYADPLYGNVTVRMIDGKMTITVGTSSGTLEHWHYDVFRATWDDPFNSPALVSFVLDADGAVGEVRLPGSPLRYRRTK
jgi:CubicO group peptidase (beta-lactamase class C family)